MAPTADNQHLTPKKSTSSATPSKSTNGKRKINSDYRNRLGAFYMSSPTANAFDNCSPLCGKTDGKRRIEFSDPMMDTDEDTAACKVSTPFSTPKKPICAGSPFLSPGHTLPGGGGEFGTPRGVLFQGDTYSDRFVPSLSASKFNDYEDQNENIHADSLKEEEEDEESRTGSREDSRTGHGSNSRKVLNTLLEAELVGRNEGGMLKFKTPRHQYEEDVKRSLLVNPSLGDTWQQAMAATPGCNSRRVPKVPFKILDAPQLQDDFYLNLVDWSSLNVIAVGLSSNVYLWSANTSKVTQLCDVGETTVTSVSWTQRGSHLAIGTADGEVQLWDVVAENKVRTLSNHSGRIGVMSWSGPVLASGGRDRCIYQCDTRSPTDHTAKLLGHRQEVCGLKWSPDGFQLASGGNDNKLLIWNAHSTSPILKFEEHKAAVKAIAWSPHQTGLLASGGGTADQCIRFWNTITGSPLNSIDTGSQVCNLAWSKNLNEIVSTHGFSLNQVVIWRYPSMNKLCTLTGHTLRVLYLAMAPDGQTIVTGAGDETLRFWSVFPGAKKEVGRTGTPVIFPSGADIR